MDRRRWRDELLRSAQSLGMIGSDELESIDLAWARGAADTERISDVGRWLVASGFLSVEQLRHVEADCVRRSGTAAPAATIAAVAETVDEPGRPLPISGARDRGASSGSSGLALRRSRTPQEVGNSLGEFPILGRLGKGGMGEVLAVEDLALGRTMAAKVMLEQNAGLMRRFLLEARITGQLEHPNIVPVYGLAQDESGTVFFTMKEVQGEDMSALLRGEDWSLARRLGVFLKVCDAMAYAHSHGIIHRDLKPSNVMVGQFGEVLVMDWGLAKRLGTEEDAPETLQPVDREELTADRTQAGSVVGTIAYMSPEQARGAIDEVDKRSDIYALGAILYELLCGAPAFGGGTVWQLLDRVAAGLFEPPSSRAQGEVPWELEAVVLKAMATEADDRYQAVTELKRDVEAYLEGRLVGAARYGTVARTWKFLKRHRYAVALVLAVGLTVAATAVVRQRQRREAIAAARVAVAEEKPAALWKRAEGLLEGVPGDPAERPVLTVAEKRKYGALIGRLMRLARVQGEVVQLSDAASDRGRQVRTLLLAARLAEVSEDFALAESCLHQAGALGEPTARERLASVGRARGARLAQRAAVVRALLDGAESGAVSTERAYQAALVRLVTHRERQTVELLLERLRAYREILVSTSRAAFHETRPAVQERKPLLSREEFDAAVEAWLGEDAWRSSKRPTSSQVAIMRMAETQLEVRGAGTGHAARPTARQLLARAQRRGLVAGGKHRDRALALVCDALGQLGDPQGVVEALGRTLSVECDPLRAIPPAVALARLAAVDARAAGILERLTSSRGTPSRRWTLGSEWWRQARTVLPSLKGRVVAPGSGSGATSASRVQRAFDLMRAGRVKEALAVGRRLVDERPTSALARVQMARLLIEAEQLGEAETAIVAALKLAGERKADRCGAWTMRAQLARVRGKHRAALRDLDRALALMPDFELALKERARVYRAMGDPRRALRDLDRLVASQPENAATRVERGRVLHGEGELERALEDFEAALRIDPRLVDALWGRGLIRTSMGRLQAALGDFDRALALAPKRAGLYGDRGQVHHRMGDYRRAYADYDRALKLKPELKPALNGRAIALRALGRPREAIRDLDAMIALEPTKAGGYYNRGLCWSALGDPRRAIADYGRAIERRPGFAEAYVNRATSRLRLRPADVDGAERDLEQALKIAPKLPDAHLHRGRVYERRRKLDAALAAYGRAIALFGTRNPAGFYQRGQLWMRRRQPKKAIRDFDRVIEMAPGHATAYAYRGEARMRLNQLGAALEDHEECLRLDPDNARGLLGRGMTLLGMRRHEEAVKALEAAVAVDPKDWRALWPLAIALHETGKHRRALERVDQALALTSMARAKKGMRSLRQKIQAALGQ